MGFAAFYKLPTGPVLAAATAKILAGRQAIPEQDQLEGFVSALHHLGANPGGWGRLRLAGRKLFPPRSVLADKFPRWRDSPWLGLLYAVHWLTMVSRYRHLLWPWPALPKRRRHNHSP